MNVELVAQMFKNYQSNVLFHLEGMLCYFRVPRLRSADLARSDGQPKRPIIRETRIEMIISK
jgi:hypothetical protein